MTDSPGRAFGLAVEEYKDFRPRPPKEIFDIIVDAVGDSRAKAVDLGAGTGHGTEPLLSRFDQVTAVEVDLVMAAELEGLGESLSVRVLPAENAEFEPGSLDLVTACMSFHWMDRRQVAQKVLSWLRPGGVFALYGYGRLEFPDAPDLNALIEEEMYTLWTKFFPHDARSLSDDEVLSEVSGFSLTKREVPHFVSMTAEEITGHMASTSTAGAWARSTGNVAGYWTDFNGRLDALEMEWPTRVDFSKTILLAKKAAT